MTCHEAQEALLEQLERVIPANAELAAHLATCPECAQFESLHRALDHQLAAAISPATLSPQFRQTLRARLEDHEPSSTWADFLPDLAHVAGCALAIAILLYLLPEYSRAVLYAGAGFTAVTYFLQAVLRSSLDRTSL